MARTSHADSSHFSQVLMPSSTTAVRPECEQSAGSELLTFTGAPEKFDSEVLNFVGTVENIFHA
jgi:hypothetical protein